MGQLSREERASIQRRIQQIAEWLRASPVAPALRESLEEERKALEKKLPDAGPDQGQSS